MSIPEEAEVRFAQPSDIPALRALDRWPRDHAWRQKIAAQEVLELGPQTTIPPSLRQ